MNTRPQADARADLEKGFTLGELRVNPDEGEIAGPGGVQKLDPKVMSVLVMLAAHSNRVVAREELLARLWPGVVVTDDALSRCLYELRRQLAAAGDSEEFRGLVETLPKRGYRLNAEVTPIEPADAIAPAGGHHRRWMLGALAAVAVALAVAIIAGRPSPDASGTSIAVLPFADMSETQDQAYLADGIAEEILDKLNQSTDLRVIARTSSFVFRGQVADVAQIARKLGVTHVLEGSIRRSGDDLRVTAQLIRAADSSHVWSTTFERRLGDLFAIQDEIAVAVASALQATLNLDRAGAATARDFTAYDLAYQAEYLYYRRAPGDIERSVELFEQAVKVDPHYARAWAALAGAYSMQAWATDPPSALLRARQGKAAMRAVELDPSSALAHARLAQYYWEAGETSLAREHLARAFELDPSDPLVLGYLASDALDAGDFDTAIAHQRRALLRDPMSTVARQNLGVTLIADGRLEEALANQRALMEINPDAGPDREIEIARILVLLGRNQEAATAALHLPPGKQRDQAFALMHRDARHRREADAALGRLEAYVPAPPLDTPEHTVVDSVRLAEIYAYRGRFDDALATLSAKRRDLERHPESATYTWLLRQESRLSPFLKPLHADARWAALFAESA